MGRAQAAVHNPHGVVAFRTQGTTVTVSGKAVDPDRASGIRINYYLNAKLVRASRTNTGDRFIAQVKLRPGKNVIKVVALNTGVGTRSATLASRTINSQVLMQKTTKAVKKSSAVATSARKYVGVRYVPSGSSPRSGFDCSGLTKYLYAQQGVSLPHSAQAQYAVSKKVSRAAAKPGDLVFFHGSGGIYHVGVYEGGNTMVAAAGVGKGVRFQPIYSTAISFGTPV